MEIIEFDNKRWNVINKIEGHSVEDHTSLKKNYGCDLVLKNAQNIYYILNELIEVEFEEI